MILFGLCENYGFRKRKEKKHELKTNVLTITTTIILLTKIICHLDLPKTCPKRKICFTIYFAGVQAPCAGP